MPDEVIKEEKKDEQPAPASEEKKAEPKDEGYSYQKDHNKDIRQIAKEESDKDREASALPPEEGKKPDASDPEPEKKPDEKVETKKEEAPTNPLDEAKRYVEEQKRLVAEEAQRHAKESVKEELKRTKEEELREAKEKDELIPVWEKEGRTPKDYGEIASETRRIAKLEFKREMRAEQEATRAEQAKKDAEATTQASQQVEAINSKIGKDLEKLYEGGYLVRPQSADPSDPGEKEKMALFQFGIKLNEDLKKEGKPPIDSISDIYFYHYKKAKATPPAQPAGADAPVSGARPAAKSNETKGYEYAKDHGKSYRQILLESQKR